jgi:HD-GYP domain-containing protein (c-di-GMP phosphodiesterase class II)
MAKYHHERIDGRGYPEGLMGDAIPPAAKIVALADSFDAMTTDRTYRRRKEFPEAIVDLRQNTGKQFASDVVIAFCRALLKEVDGTTRERPITRMLGKGYIEPQQARPLLIELIEELAAGAHATVSSV